MQINLNYFWITFTEFVSISIVLPNPTRFFPRGVDSLLLYTICCIYCTASFQNPKVFDELFKVVGYGKDLKKDIFTSIHLANSADTDG